jgi:ubiquinone/menaquinone biosynthesis C-methylase UbiE
VGREEVGTIVPNEDYYDTFSEVYDKRRTDPYHSLIDSLEVELIGRYGRNKRVLECGCGTGLVLQKVSKFASETIGVDLSEGMLSVARRRGLCVTKGGVTDLPFPDASFDVVYSVKVLAHVPDIRKALSEMVRVTAPGGHIIAEFYNPTSVRGLVRFLLPPKITGQGLHDHNVFYRSDTPQQAKQYFPADVSIVHERGVRIVTIAPILLRVPAIGAALGSLERALMDRIPRLGGLYCVVAQKKQVTNAA